MFLPMSLTCASGFFALALSAGVGGAHAIRARGTKFPHCRSAQERHSADQIGLCDWAADVLSLCWLRGVAPEFYVNLFLSAPPSANDCSKNAAIAPSADAIERLSCPLAIGVGIVVSAAYPG
jgi:hypothetical protein